VVSTTGVGTYARVGSSAIETTRYVPRSSQFGTSYSNVTSLSTTNGINLSNCFFRPPPRSMPRPIALEGEEYCYLREESKRLVNQKGAFMIHDLEHRRWKHGSKREKQLMGVAKGILKNAHIYQPSPAPLFRAQGRIQGSASSLYRKSLTIVERSEQTKAQYFSSASGGRLRARA
jgi:hypothetical protein